MQRKVFSFCSVNTRNQKCTTRICMCNTQQQQTPVLATVAWVAPNSILSHIHMQERTCLHSIPNAACSHTGNPTTPQPCTFSHPVQEILPCAGPEIQVLFWLDSCILCCEGSYRNEKPGPKPAWDSLQLSVPLPAWHGVGKSRNLASS